MRMLVVCGDTYHPAADIDDSLRFLIDAGKYTADWWTRDVVCPVSVLFEYKVVVVAANLGLKFGQSYMTDGAIWRHYLQQGGGLLVLHSGNAGRLSVEPIADLTGAVFIDHPPECTVTLNPDYAHPVARGVAQPIIIQDEQYRLKMSGPDIEVLLYSSTPHGVQPAGWTREVGLGRLCALTPGHRPSVWRNASCQMMLQNALAWLTRHI